MVSQRLIVGDLMGEFHLPGRFFKLFSKVPRSGFCASHHSELGSCYKSSDTRHFTRVMRMAYNIGGRKFSAEVMLTILRRLS